MKNGNGITKIPLWLIFLPVSPVIAMLAMNLRWSKRGMTQSDPCRRKATRTVLLGCIVVGFVVSLPCALLGKLQMNTEKDVWLAAMLVWMYVFCVVIAAVIREIEYRCLVKVCSEE